MSKDNLEVQIQNIKLQIEALKRQKGKLERLMIIFMKHKEILDNWNEKTIESLEIRRGLGLKPIELPDNEKKELNRILKKEVIVEYEEHLNTVIYQYLDENMVFSIEDIITELSKVDQLIFELELLYKSRIVRREKTALRMAKDIILKRAVPIMGGTALIAINLNAATWTSVIVGALSIFKGLESI